MKTLILTATIGAGHNQVAKAIEKQFVLAGEDVMVYNLFDNSKLCTLLISNIGFKLSLQFPNIANQCYKNAKKTDKHIYYTVIKYLKKKVLEVINSYQPDNIISTHISGFLFVQKYQDLFVNQNVANRFVITDYEITPGLIHRKDNEYVFAPDDYFCEKLIEKGFPKEQIYPSGIPINDKFYNKITKEEAVKELNLQLPPDKEVILVTGGGKGLGNALSIIKELSNFDDVVLICVAGRNAELKKKVDKMAQSSKAQIISFGFTDKMEYILSIADVVIGKAGGLTITESLSKEVPFVSCGNMPFPENGNCIYFMENNVAKSVLNKSDLYKEVTDEEYLSNKEIKFKNLINKNSAKAILDYCVANQNAN